MLPGPGRCRRRTRRASSPTSTQRWWLLAQFDSALVSSADGMSAAWYKRDPRQFKDQMVRSAQLHARLYREWDSLAERYREALPELDLARGVEADVRRARRPDRPRPGQPALAAHPPGDHSSRTTTTRRAGEWSFCISGRAGVAAARLDRRE